jgi:hypothetical protein
MDQKNQVALEEHKKNTSISSSIALGATGIAAFTTGLPIATGILVGTAVLSSGIAAYNYYKALEDERVSQAKS